MNFIELLTKPGTASSIIIICLVAVLGILFGKIKLLRIKLGIAGILFSGLLVGHLGAVTDPHVLHFIKEFGLILFVYSIGLEVGPRFLPSLKKNGLRINLLASGIVLTGFLTAVAIKFIFNVPISVITGVMCGAVTNTPALGAAQQTIGDIVSNADIAAANAQTVGMAYAVAYPFGIFGIIISMILLRVIYKINVKKEEEQYRKEVTGMDGKLIAINIEITNQNLIGKSIEFIIGNCNKAFVPSRIERNGEFLAADSDFIIEQGDKLYGVSTPTNFKNIELNLGKINETKEQEISGRLGMQQVRITNKKLAGQSIKQIGISRRFPVNITRIYRNGLELMPTEEDSVEFGDTVRIVGEKTALPEVANLLGNSIKDLSHPNILPIFMGILFGVLIGLVPIHIPGLPAPAKLGLAGGPLLIALILGHKGRIGKMDFYITPSANLFIRELGIALFLACVGLSSGKYFVETLLNEGYIWMLYGMAITFVPLIIFAIIARIMKLNYLSICGLLSGSMTDPPALEFANSIAPVQAQSTAYATVYPLVMFLRVLLAQVLVLLFS
ncbi:putative transporter [Marinifilum sp. D714]|uniref:putative transporter n=1 Tax=Marinifilum sp. D714 TaxID=2937523 RepID=UPI0027D0D927|nr:putative transporter [Marinifilum sp. D714]MDQ2178989.1 putative transporter [Marinifilum sp. D714]